MSTFFCEDEGGKEGSFFHVCPEGVNIKYRLIVFDDSKEAFIPLTEFYHDQVNRISELVAGEGTVHVRDRAWRTIKSQSSESFRPLFGMGNCKLLLMTLCCRLILFKNLKAFIIVFINLGASYFTNVGSQEHCPIPDGEMMHHSKIIVLRNIHERDDLFARSPLPPNHLIGLLTLLM